MAVLAQARIFRMDLPAPLTELGAAFAVSGYAAYAAGSAAEVLATGRTPRRLDVVTDAPVDVAALLASSAGLVDVSLPPLHLSDSMVDLWLPGGSPLRIRTVTSPRVLASAGAHLGGLADVLADVCSFSVSAVAVNLADGGVYDPHEGLRDVKAGRLRLISSPSTAAATAAFLLAAEFGLRVPPRLRGRLLSADRTDPAATRALLADIVTLPDPMVPVRRAHRAGALEVSVPEVAALFLEDRQGRHKDILVHTLRTAPFPPGRSRGWWRIRIGRSVTTWLPIRLMADPVSPFARFARFRGSGADSSRLQLASRLASSDRFAFSADALLAVVAGLLAPHVPAVFGV